MRNQGGTRGKKGPFRFCPHAVGYSLGLQPKLAVRSWDPPRSSRFSAMYRLHFVVHASIIRIYTKVTDERYTSGPIDTARTALTVPNQLTAVAPIGQTALPLAPGLVGHRPPLLTPSKTRPTQQDHA